MKRIFTIALSVCLFSSIYGQCFEDRHNSTINNAWVSCTMSNSPDGNDPANRHWIMYDLGEQHELHDLTIWNYNHIEELSRGVEQLKVSLSIDGLDFIEIATVGIPMADGSSTYEGYEALDFNGAVGRYILLTAMSNYGANCTGIAEMRVMLTSNNTVPVELAIFEVSKSDIDGIIDWESITEVNVDYYLLQRSFGDIDDWQDIYEEDIDIDSYTKKTYAYVDRGVAHFLEPEEKVYYRLKIVDNDGAYEFSDKKAIEFDADLSPTRLVISPNPVSSGDKLSIDFTSSGNQQDLLTITDIQGKQIFKQRVSTQIGENSLVINLPNSIIAGIYALQIGEDKQAKLIIR